MHREASKVLYEENQWVMIAMNYSGLRQGLKDKGYPIIVLRQMVAKNAELPFDGTPSLRIDVRVTHFWDQEPQQYIIATLEVATELCLSLTADRAAHELQLAVHVHESTSAGQDHQQMVLECLENIHGVGKTTVTAMDPPSLGDDTVKLMMTPSKTIDDGDEELARGHIPSAEALYLKGG